MAKLSSLIPWRRQGAQDAARQALESEKQAIIAAVREEISRANIGVSPMMGAPMIPPPGKARSIFAFDYPWRYTVPMTPQRRPGSNVTVETLRNIADTYDVLRACINHLIREVMAVPIRVVPRDGTRKSAQQSKRIRSVQEFFEVPGGLGGDGERREHFEAKLVNDLCVVGAGAVWYQNSRSGKPLQVIAIDAATIRPRVDPWGFPGPDDFVYEQWVQGVQCGQFKRQEMRYDGIYPKSYSPYFWSPIEWLLGCVNSALAADQWNRDWLLHGATVSDVYAMPETWTPEEIREFKLYLDSMLEGNSQARQQMRLLPSGTQKVSAASRKDQDFQEYELWLLRRCCATFGVQPASIGFAGEQYKSTEQASMKSTTEFGVGSILTFRKALYDDIITRMGHPDLEIENVRSQEEAASSRIDRNVKCVNNSIKTINEARAEEGMDPIENGDEPLVQFGTVTLKSVLQQAEQQAQAGDGSGDTPPPPPPPDDGGEGAAPGTPPPGETPDAGVAPGEQPSGGAQQPWQSAAATPPPEDAEASAGGGGQKPLPDWSTRLAGIRSELAQWEKKALNRIRSGKSAASSFHAEYLPAVLCEEILSRLSECTLPSQVRTLFREAEDASTDLVERTYFREVKGHVVPMPGDDPEKGKPKAAAPQIARPPKINLLPQKPSLLQQAGRFVSQSVDNVAGGLRDAYNAQAAQIREERLNSRQGLMHQGREDTGWTPALGAWDAKEPTPLQSGAEADAWLRKEGIAVAAGVKGKEFLPVLSGCRDAIDSMRATLPQGNGFSLGFHAVYGDHEGTAPLVQTDHYNQVTVNQDLSERVEQDAAADRKAMESGETPSGAVPGWRGAFLDHYATRLYARLPQEETDRWESFYNGTRSNERRWPSAKYGDSAEMGWREVAASVAARRPIDPRIAHFVAQQMNPGAFSGNADPTGLQGYIASLWEKMPE